LAPWTIGCPVRFDGGKWPFRLLGAKRLGIKPEGHLMTSAIPSVQTFTMARRSVRRKALALGLVGSLLVIALGVVRTKEWDLVTVLDIAGLVGLVWLIALPSDWLLYWLSGRNARLLIGPDGLCLETGGLSQRIPWNQITQVQIKTGEDMTPIELDIYTSEGRALELREFERLSEIVQLVQASVPPPVEVKRA
jgi:hypothetical protein